MLQQHDILTVTSTNRTDFDFKDIQPPGGALDSDTARWYGSWAGPATRLAQPAQAFANGDVVRNQPHTAVSITNVVQVGNTTTITVTSVNGIAVGHQVTFSGIGGSVELNQDPSEDKRFFVESVNTGHKFFHYCWNRL